MSNATQLKERMNKFIDELGIPFTSFCKRIGLSYSSIRKWKTNKLDLSNDKLATIDDYLKKYGF